MKKILFGLVFASLISTHGIAQTSVPLTDRNIVKLLADPIRPKMYALNKGSGTLPGTLLALNPTNGTTLAELAMGLSPTDMAIAGAGDALYVVNTGSRNVTKVDLSVFAVANTRSISTPNTYDVNNPLHIAAGRSNVVYFTDGGWSPGVYTLDFYAGTIISLFDDDSGAGGLAVTRDGNTFYTWRQYGWGAGNVNSWVTRYNPAGTNLIPQESSFSSWRRDPFDTPILLTTNETVLFNKQQMFAATNLSILHREFAENIYAISSRGDWAFGSTKVYNSWTGFELTNFDSASSVQAVTGNDRFLFRYRTSPSELIIHSLSSLVGDGWETNSPPVPAFTRTPTNSTTITTITFNGSSSTDDQGSSGLEYRWDWENDGVFDTAFTNSPTALHRFIVAGTKTSALQIKDRYGAVSTATQTFNVSHEDDPGLPGGGNPLFEVQFAAADVVFDPTRPYAYVSGYSNKTLVVLNLTNGLIERQFNFEWNAESITVSPNGQYLYLALLRRPHSSYWFGGHTNYIAEINLGQLLKTKEFEILADPYDLAVTDGGILIVPGGSDQWTDIRTYSTATGQLLGTSGIRQGSRIALHPSQTAVYTADTDLSPSDIQRYTFNPTTGAFLSSWDSPYHGDYPMSGNVWCHPSGTNVLVRGGGIFTSSPTQANDLRYTQTLSGGTVEAVAFDPAHQALFTVGSSKLWYYNLNTQQLISSQVVTNGTRFVHAAGTNLYVAWSVGASTRFQRLVNPAVGAETNRVPIAAFTRTPTNATTLVTITFDGSSSTDDQGGGSALEYRWDWENDGSFDTTFTNQPVATYRYNLAGTKTAALQVKDRYGAINTVTQTFTVVQENDPGVPGGGNPAFELQFAATDVAFDPVRPYAYVSGYANKALVFLNLTNGFIDRQFNFDWNPESIAISPDGKKMYVALLRRNHSSYWFGGHTNYIAEFDLVQKVKLKEFQILADPYDLAVTDNGILIVPGGSDQWTDIRTYSTTNGQLLGTASIRQASRIALHPSQTAVYTADTDSSPSDIQRYTFNPTGAFLSSWDSPYHGDYAMSGNVWCHPNGTNVLVRGGNVFSSSQTQSLDMRYLQSLSGGLVEATAFDTSHNALFTLGNSKLWYYNLNTFQLVSSQTITNAARYVHALEKNIYIGWVGGGKTFFQALHNPSLPDPFVVQQPQNQTVTVGNSAIFNVTVSGASPFQFQWFFEGSILVNQTNATLILNNVQSAQEGNYYVVVTNSFGSVTSSPARLTVLAPPAITQQPQNLNAPAGSIAVLQVAAIGTAPLRYQWSFEGINLSGATNASLSLLNIQAQQEGTYRVLVENSVGSILSSPAIIRVLPSAPSVLTQPLNANVPAGTNFQFFVSATGSAPLQYQWQFQGMNLPGATSQTLTLNNVQTNHVGDYRVVISNFTGVATSSNASLAITPTVPWFTLNPVGRSAAAGTNITLSGSARGLEPLSYQWQFNGTNLLSSTNSTLALTNVTVQQSGQYTLVAINPVGSATSAVANVIITGAPPVFVQQPSSTSLNVGSTLTLNSRATGSEPLNYQWRFMGTNLAGQTSSSLVITNITEAMGGTYLSVASNEFGSATSAVATVTVRVPPLITTNFSNIVVNLGSDVLISAAAQGSSPITYSWEFNGIKIPNATSNSISLTNLQFEQAGSYRLIVSNAFGTASSRMTLFILGQPGVAVSWGDNLGGQTNVPASLADAVEVTGGDFHSVALVQEREVVAWGYNGDGQTNVPPGLSNIVSIAAGGDHTLALRLNGQPAAWGRNDFGQITVPLGATSVVAIAAGERHSVALRQDGTLVAWGDNTYGQRTIPSNVGVVTKISAGRHHTLALRNNGTVAAWGLNNAGQATPPANLTGVKAIAAGYLHNLALRSNGTVVAWGDNTYGQCSVPVGLSNVVSIAAGEIHSVARLSDGRVLAWGNNSYGQIDMPEDVQNAYSIASGYYHGLAVVPPMLKYQPGSNGLALWWRGPYKLQFSTNAFGPYQDLEISSPSINNASGPNGFYRLKRITP